MPVTRRAFLRATATATGLGLALTGTATADHPQHQPDHVTLTYDTSTLKQYRPLLEINHLDVRPQALYGWVATSPEYQTDVCVYWAEYSHQEGVTEYDSHYGDHEPCYVFVDSDTGDVEKVIASVYHWMAGTGHATALNMQGTHAKLRVINPWHHYTSTDADGQQVDLGDLTQVFDAWRNNGLEDDLQPGTVVNPWLMESRGYWWRDDVGSLSTDALIVGLARKLGVHQAGQLG